MEFQHELIIPNEGLPFKLFLFEGYNGNYIREKHWHTSIEIFAVMDGELTFFLNQEEYPLTAGKFLIINSNEIHSINALEKNRTAVLQIPLKQFEGYFTAERFIRFSRPETAATEKRKEANRKMAALMQDIFRIYEKGKKTDILSGRKGQGELSEKTAGYEFRMLALFYEIMYLLVTEYRETEVQERELRHNRHLAVLSRITTYMRDHYQEDLKLSQVAAAFGYSPEYLSRMFQKYIKVNFKTYLQDIRMGYAYGEVVHTDKTISQIALDHGFCGSRAFAREFQKRYGSLPSAVRKEQNIS